jgi:phosphopantetheinyl transferase (holo-ACP synthase)
MTFDRVLSTSYARLSQCAAAQREDSRDWLTAAERTELDRLGHALRRRQWLAGRWLAKQLILRAAGNASLADVQILTRDGEGPGVRPQIRLAGRRLPWSVSISHSEHGALAALVASDTLAVGVDLTVLRPDHATQFGPGFRRLWFTPGEQRWLAADPQRRIATLWAVKEAVYKACNTGEAWDPRQVEIVPTESDGFQCRYRGLPLAQLGLGLRDLDGHVAAVVQLPLVHSVSPADRAMPRNRANCELECLEQAAALPATHDDLPRRPQVSRDIRFDQPTNHQPVVLFRKPS